MEKSARKLGFTPFLKILLQNSICNEPLIHIHTHTYTYLYTHNKHSDIAIPKID